MHRSPLRADKRPSHQWRGRRGQQAPWRAESRGHLDQWGQTPDSSSNTLHQGLRPLRANNLLSDAAPKAQSPARVLLPLDEKRSAIRADWP